MSREWHRQRRSCCRALPVIVIAWGRLVEVIRGSWERSARALEIELSPKRSVESSTSSQSTSIYLICWTLIRKHDYPRHSRLL